MAEISFLTTCYEPDACHKSLWSRGSSVITMNTLRAERTKDRSSIINRLPKKCPDRLWSLPRLFFSGCGWLFDRGWIGRSRSLTPCLVLPYSSFECTGKIAVTLRCSRIVYREFHKTSTIRKNCGIGLCSQNVFIVSAIVIDTQIWGIRSALTRIVVLELC